MLRLTLLITGQLLRPIHNLLIGVTYWSTAILCRLVALRLILIVRAVVTNSILVGLVVVLLEYLVMLNYHYLLVSSLMEDLVYLVMLRLTLVCFNLLTDYLRFAALLILLDLEFILVLVVLENLVVLQLLSQSILMRSNYSSHSLENIRLDLDMEHLKDMEISRTLLVVLRQVHLITLVLVPSLHGTNLKKQLHLPTTVVL